MSHPTICDQCGARSFALHSDHRCRACHLAAEAAPILQGIPFPHGGDHDLHVCDPTNPDGSCAHDYLCAYCNAQLDGDVAKRVAAGVNLTIEEVGILVRGITGYQKAADSARYRAILVRMDTALLAEGLETNTQEAT